MGIDIRPRVGQREKALRAALRRGERPAPSDAGARERTGYIRLRISWRRLRVYGRTSDGQRPVSVAATHSGLNSTSGPSIS